MNSQEREVTSSPDEDKPVFASPGSIPPRAEDVDPEFAEVVYWAYEKGQQDPSFRAKIREALYTDRRETPKVGRNDPCPCGSGLKFKKCCLNKPNKPPPDLQKVPKKPGHVGALTAIQIAASLLGRV